MHASYENNHGVEIYEPARSSQINSVSFVQPSSTVVGPNLKGYSSSALADENEKEQSIDARESRMIQKIGSTLVNFTT